MGVTAGPALATGDTQLVATLPFDHTRRAASALVDDGGRRMLVVKGAPEQVIAHCVDGARLGGAALRRLFADGRRVVAVAARRRRSCR